VLIAAHCSAEPGHAGSLRCLGLAPYLNDWQMRLGEGTRALLLMPLLDAAAAISSGMATFRDAGIPTDGS
jgi:nicotinate-nucleotide--dimethylbenzimidazole phosphoribosyltransferase